MPDLTQTPLADLFPDEASRPKMPPIVGATDGERRAGRHLAAIHRHYLMEMARIAAVLERIKAGDSPPAELAEIILDTDMRRNFEAAGSICGHQCQVLTMHHDIEEQSMFPRLANQGNSALAKIVAKLRDEHLIVHELLNRLGAAAQVLAAEPTEAHFDHAYEVFIALRRAVISHFGYEETELAEAIGHYLGGI